MSNPFENVDAAYSVLVNEEGQHSLWPAHIEVPAGWEAVHGEAARQECVAFVEASWRDMRPASLIAAGPHD
ncbi:MbtH family protein [Streptomyces sp. NBC_01803]|uniref:MbtH family protein n=1 Tax=Streptomyces sp. NBC_01803 TaxID=2975946 RepID=UPI002DD9F826|nr:MbtH family protein [Streptomyces sp. NBC_01803]WSA43069.1 MbtH family protein [Streptomyces sp. NBC_01803]